MSRCCWRAGRPRRRPGLTVALVVAAATLAVGPDRSPIASASTAQQPPAAIVRSNCGGCHTLAAAGASGTLGPSLDTSTKTVDQIVELIGNGPELGGVMPAFKDTLTAAEIELIAQYVVEVRGKAGGKTAPPEPKATTEAATSSPALTLTVAARPQHPTELTLRSQLRSSADPRGRTIAFFVVSREFGQPANVPIGTATTAANGIAAIVYTPTWTGKEQFVARLAGSGVRVRAATALYRVTAATPGPLAGLHGAAANPGWPLASVGQVFLDTILAVVAFIWLGLIVTLAVAFGWMPRLARGEID